MFEVGSQVERNESGQIGMVLACRERVNDTPMLEVKWLSGVQQWIPSDRVAQMDVVKTPPKQDSKPAYLKELRKSLKGEAQATRAAKDREFATRQLADTLAVLSDNRKHKRKTRNQNKARKLIAAYESGVILSHTRRSFEPRKEFGTFTKSERRWLTQRIERDKDT